MRANPLDDPEWLAEQYNDRSAAQIARELGVWTTTVTDAMRRHDIETLPPGEWQRRQRAPELDDPQWLADNYNTRRVSDIATELNVTVSTVSGALRRNGITVRDTATSRRM
jgi:IS30 family transposase